jgi:ATP-binding cassette, subfamily B, multidrug efflux pump
MSLSDRIYRPFEQLIRPLDLPVEPMPSSGPLALILHFARLFKWVLVAVGCLSVLSGLVSLAVVWAIAHIVDGVAAEGPQLFLQNNAALLAAFFVLLAVIDPVLVFLQRALTSQAVGVGFPAALRWQGYKAVERQDVAFFHDLFAGQVASRIQQVSRSVQRQLMTAVESIPGFAIQFIGSFVLLTALAWPLAVPVLFWIVGNGLIAWFAVPVYTRLSSETARTQSRATGAMTDIYSNIQMVKLFAAEDSEAGAVRGVLDEVVTTELAQRRTFITTDMAVYMLNVGLSVSVLAIGLWGMVAGFVSIGNFVAAVTIVRSLNGSSRAFIGLGQSMAQTFGTIRDAMPVLTTPPTILDAPDARPLMVTRGEIRFERVGFEYKSGKSVVQDLSLSVAPQEKIGLVGVSGAGKSTMVSLLLRLYDLDAGRILIDGQDIAGVTQESLRSQIGVITQDVALLNRSIRDNIRYGRPSATDADIMAAARMAEAQRFILDLKDSAGRSGLDAFVGDRGIKLSGGQRQRVAIARAVLKNAPILILDEATSSLDSEAEAAIERHMTDLMENKTVLCIAHRLATIARMDRIVVLDEGRIAEMGTPADLLESGGLYARLWARQTGGYMPTL